MTFLKYFALSFALFILNGCGKDNRSENIPTVSYHKPYYIEHSRLVLDLRNL